MQRSLSQPLPADFRRPPMGGRRLAERVRDGGMGLFDWFRGVRWSVSFVAFLVYIFSLVTMRLMVGTEAMVVALLGLPFEKHKLKFPQPAVLLTIFVLWCVVGYMMSPFQGVVATSLEQLTKAGIIMFVALNVLSDWNRFRMFLLVFLGSFLFYPGRGSILFWATGAYTVFGRAIWLYIYENPNDLAGLTFLPLACALYMMGERGHKLARLGAVASVGVCAFVIVITQSRGAMLALIGMGLLSLANQRKKLRAIAAVLFLGGIVAMFTPDDIMNRFIGLVEADSIEEADPENSAIGRWTIWKVSIEVFAGRPVTGWGLGAYPLQHSRVSRGRQDLLPGARGARDTHSTYLRLLGETGIVGLSLFLGLVGSVMLRISRAAKRLRRIDPERALQLRYLRNAMVGFLMAGVFASYEELAFLYVHLAVLWSGAVLAERSLAQARVESRQRLATPGATPLPRVASVR
ncbi:MAG: O-antigen ligase family protein [Gemmatimonadota bacterium]